MPAKSHKKLFRRIGLVAATAALLGATLFPTTSGAAVPKVDVGNDHVTCDTMNGTITFAPPLEAATGGDVIRIKGFVDGCTDTDNPSVVFLRSSFSGKLTTTGTGFAALLGINAAQGQITFKWKTASSSPLLQTQSIITMGAAPGSLCTSLYVPAPPLPATQYGQFQFGGGVNCLGPVTAPVSVSGAFTGGDGGASTLATGIASESIGALSSTLTNTGKLKNAHIGMGTVTIG